MAKFWTIDEALIGTAAPLNEDIWFKLWQPLLLQMVNTEYGRDLLCIPRHHPPIVKMSKNFIQWIVEDRGETLIMSGQAHPGHKWANVIRYRWPQFKAFAKTFYEKYYDGQKILMPLLDGRVIGMKGLVSANVTDTFYPAAGTNSPVDGVVKHAYAGGSGVVWATIIAAAGTTAWVTQDDFVCMDIEHDNVTDKYIGVARGIFLFDLSGISGTPTFTSGVASLNGNSASGKADSPANTPNLNWYSSNPASNSNLTGTDYATLGSTAFSDTVITYANMVTNDTYVDRDLNASGIAALNKGIVKLGTRNANFDVAATTPTTWGSFGRSYWSTWFADKTGTTYDPKLVPVWSVAAGAYRKIINVT